MRVLPENFMPTSFTLSQRAFVDSWFSLTHAQSLDSHRVRTLNARLVLRELVDVCKTVEAGVIHTLNRKTVAEEAFSALERDPIFKNKFADHHRFLTRRLKHPDCVNGKEPKRAIELRIAAQEAFLAIDPVYYSLLVAELQAAIASGRPVRDIHTLVGSLLTDLTDRGFSIGNLSGFYKFFDTKVKAGSAFDERFNYLISWLQRPSEPHEVVLKLSRASKLLQIKTFGDWQFESSVPKVGTDPHEAAFLRPGMSVVFAKCVVDARDHREAGAIALQSWSRVSDQLLFDFLSRPLPMDSRYRSIRRRGKRLDIGYVELQVPNPREWSSHRDLQQFSQQLDRALSSACRLREEDKRQVEAALRYLRLGTEATSLESMFVTRWIAIESLLRTVSPDELISGVTKSVAALMAITYLPKLNSDLCGTARYLKRPVPAACAGLSGGATDTSALTWQAFASIARDATARAALAAEFQRWPLYQDTLEHFGILLADPKALRAALESHEQRVQWQMQRAYRVRNEIVHSASHSISLLSLVAHLEYYLRTTARTIVRALDKRDHTDSLRDLFSRTATVRTRLDEDLEAAAEGKGAIPTYLLDPLELNA